MHCYNNPKIKQDLSNKLGTIHILHNILALFLFIHKRFCNFNAYFTVSVIMSMAGSDQKHEWQRDLLNSIVSLKKYGQQQRKLMK
jgi:hypothetical protein